jgi:light-regulated signal transduction histidine kinase (bacteriophytochrome)
MVASYTQLLAKKYKGRLDDNADRYIAFAVDGAKRMQQLIRDLLALSCLTTGAQHSAQTCCEAAFEHAVTNLQMAVSEAQAQVTHDRLPLVVGDGSQLIQLFQNLIGNSLKFRGTEIPSVHVSAHDSGREWLFTVRDNGIGIDPQHAQKIFVMFQRLHMRSEYPGTGIGLAICKKIVEYHGGRIWVESHPGCGSTFYFTLPKATPERSNGVASLQSLSCKTIGKGCEATASMSQL